MTVDIKLWSDTGTHVPEGCVLGACSVQSVLHISFELILPRTPA